MWVRDRWRAHTRSAYPLHLVFEFFKKLFASTPSPPPPVAPQVKVKEK